MSTPPKKRADRRPTLTLKGDQFGPEFRSLLNKAARKAGQTQATFVAETLDREARRVLAGTPPDTPDGGAPPAVVDAEWKQNAEQKFAEFAKLADEVAELRRLQQITLWRRVRDRFR